MSDSADSSDSGVIPEDHPEGRRWSCTQIRDAAVLAALAANNERELVWRFLDELDLADDMPDWGGDDGCYQTEYDDDDDDTWCPGATVPATRIRR